MASGKLYTGSENLGILSLSIAGSSNVTLTTAQSWNGIWILTGAITANISVIAPFEAGDIKNVYNNTSGAFSVTIISTSGAGVTVTQGKRANVVFDGTNVVYTNTDPNTLGLSTPISVAQGGTGATTAALARTNLVAAASGANTDITSLAGITGGISMAGALSGNASPVTLSRLSLSVAGGTNVTLTNVQYNNYILEFTGAITANISVIVPLISGAEWRIFNGTSGAFTLTVIGATGTGVPVTQGKRCLVYCDGTNIQRLTADV